MKKYFTVTYSVKFSILLFLNESHEKTFKTTKFLLIIFLIRFHCMDEVVKNIYVLIRIMCSFALLYMLKPQGLA